MHVQNWEVNNVATNAEIQNEQRLRLYLLLKIELDNKDFTVKGLEEKISMTKAVMRQEDIDHVEKMITKP